MRFSWASWLLSQLDSKLPFNGPGLYILLKTTKPGPVIWKNQDDLTFKILKESLINPLALGYTNYKLPFVLFVYEKEGNTLRVLTQNMGATTTSRLLQPTIRSHDPALRLCLRAIPATAFLVKATEEIVLRSSLTIFVPHAVKALLNS